MQQTTERPGAAIPHPDEAGKSSCLDICLQHGLNVYVSPAGEDVSGLIEGGEDHRHHDFSGVGVEELVRRVQAAVKPCMCFDQQRVGKVMKYSFTITG